MIHPQLHYVIAQQQADELRRADESGRLQRSIHVDRRALVARRWITRLTMVLHRPRSVVRSRAI